MGTNKGKKEIVDNSLSRKYIFKIKMYLPALLSHYYPQFSGQWKPAVDKIGYATISVFLNAASRETNYIEVV